MNETMKKWNKDCRDMKAAGFTDDNRGRCFMLDGVKKMFTGTYTWQGSYNCLPECKIEVGVIGRKIDWDTVKTKK